ncbi:unnamed protein product [Spirodela intermedia]|uniref:BHLH domain-containing protein n=1 Tax=Spirodela intermedia TaxID=51605 RepID=A0A7I8J2P3_SPIIN|nr:unnamed protein product [Spirodela intermedia]CAA6663671.1 unnamed protein product [Spirodela intermedia]
MKFKYSSSSSSSLSLSLSLSLTDEGKARLAATQDGKTDREFVKLLWESAEDPGKAALSPALSRSSPARIRGENVPEHPMATRAAARPAAAEDSPASHAPPFGPLQDDELVAWLSCPIDDYCSELLSDISGADVVSSTEAAAPAAASSRAPAGPMEAGRMSNLKELPKKEAAAPKPHGEDESTDRRRPADKGQAVNKKRSRSAEIHNLSERRRRDRINEKMRALQALVPSCNKVDRASMLDEVIEYLKSLQMQVQV